MADLSLDPTIVIRSSTGQQVVGTAGATITQGQALYIDTANSNVLKLADSNGTTPANSCAGIALTAGSSGQPVVYVAADTALAIGATLTSGAAIYLSDTPGGITATYADIASGSTVIVLGVANTNGSLNLNPVTGGVK